MRADGLKDWRSSAVRTFCNRGPAGAGQVHEVILRGSKAYVSGTKVSLDQLRLMGLRAVEILRIEGPFSRREIRNLLPGCGIKKRVKNY